MIVQGLDEAQHWIHETLAAQNITIDGQIEQIHAQPWSTILRIPSSAGMLYFKAVSGMAAHEIAVTAMLGRLQPQHTPQLVAHDSGRGWMMMRDGGQRLREILQTQPDWRHWEGLLPQFAALQQAAAQSPNVLLQTGLPDRSLEAFPALYRQLLNESDWFQVDQPDGLTATQYQHLHDLVPVVQERCDQLQGYAIPETIHHGDLHDGNIFYNEPHYAFFDWGDSSYSHPFFSLRTAYVSAEIRFNLEENAPELNRLRDAYLPAWREYESVDTLQAAFDAARDLWSLSSAFIWRQTILSSPPEKRPDYAHVMPSLMQEFLSQVQSGR